jgi:hypothetical protein
MPLSTCQKIIAVAALLLIALPVAASAETQQRTALVIGNSGYRVSPLINPGNDATDVAAALRQLGFDVVLHIDADQRTMERVIREFGHRLRKGGVGLFYYAGHGVQVDGRNYLIPVGADIKSEPDVEFEAVDAGRVLAYMEDAGNNLNIIILDACRDNPFAGSFRSAGRGLSRMDAPTGSILAYATAPGAVAADGARRNGVYTSYLLKYLTVPGLEIGPMFRKIRIDVVKATDGQQIPWESSSLMGDFYFMPQRGIRVADQPTPPPETPAQAPMIVSKAAPVSKPPPPIKSNERFQVNTSGVVFDTKTGFEWLPGPDRDIAFDRAVSWVRSQATADGAWHMPGDKELRSLCKGGVGAEILSPVLKLSNSRVWLRYTGRYPWEYFDLRDCSTSFTVGRNWDNVRVLAVRKKE